MTHSGYVVITGASKGIGKAIAFEFASKGFPVILIARTLEELQENASEIRKKYQVDAMAYPADISESGAAETFFTWVNERKIQLQGLVNNAGFTVWGKFHEMHLHSHLELMDLNVTAILIWTHVLVPLLQKSANAFVMNVGSTGAFQPTPFMNVYGASKIFLRHFSRSLRWELKSAGISVTCLMPGPTYSSIHIRSQHAELVQRAGKLQMKAETVARIGVRATLKGRAECIPGILNQLNFVLTAIFPFWISIPVAAKILRKN